MNDSIPSILLRYGIPSVVVVVASAFCILAVALFLNHTRVAALLLVGVILTFVTATSFGYLHPPEFSVYTKGARLLFFPIIQFYLYGLFLAFLFQNRLAGRTVMKGAGSGWMLAFAALFACHVAYGLATGVSLASVFSTNGLVNVLHMSMIAYVVTSALRDDRSFELPIRVLLAIAVLRGAYALARFLFASGDPQNAYRNVAGLGLKITFWDATEGLIASLVVLYCVGRLLRDWSTLSLAARGFFAGAITVELLVILFSYRRTNWYGLLLATFFFAWQLPRHRHAVAARLAVVSLLLPVIYLSTARYQSTLGQSNLSLVERIAPDIAMNGIASTSSRFYELYRALETVQQHPLVGVGAWGEFEVGASDTGLKYHEGNFDLVHSGLGHVLLKSGLIGLVLFCGIFFSSWRFAARARANVPERHLALFDGCRAGLVFMLPSLLFGTPIIEFRAMALLGLLLAVPIAISRQALPTTQPPCGQLS